MKQISAISGLLKIRLSLAVTFSALTGFIIYDNQPGINMFILFCGVFFLSTGAAALNQYTERDLDAKMERTMQRPLPAEIIEPDGALKIAMFLIISGTLVILLTGLIPSLLGLITVFLYNFVYTSLKKISWFAIVPGALVGAIPPVIGFTAAGGSIPSAEIIFFSAFMFLWQLPHFWLIIVRYRNDYRLAGFKTLPGNIGEMETKRLVFIWAILTSVLLGFFSANELVFNSLISLILIPLNIFFILLFYRALYTRPAETSARNAFILINSFSFLIMILFIVNSFFR
jgi:protoheme IX farnesyltransferase